MDKASSHTVHTFMVLVVLLAATQGVGMWAGCQQTGSTPLGHHRGCLSRVRIHKACLGFCLQKAPKYVTTAGARRPCGVCDWGTGELVQAQADAEANRTAE
jgi:hypothetical protein